MNQMVAVIKLSEQQTEYVLAGYAAFQSPEKIHDEFCACFPEAVGLLRSDPDWEERLMVSIRHLYPGCPQFEKREDAKDLHNLFSGLRRNYLSTIKDSRMSSARSRLELMDETYRQLELHASVNPESFADCKKLQLQVLKQAKEESYEFFEAQFTGHGMTEEQLKELMRKLSPEELAEFNRRYKDGLEHPDAIIMDIRQRAIAASVEEEEHGETQTPETEQAQEVEQAPESEQLEGGA